MIIREISFSLFLLLLGGQIAEANGYLWHWLVYHNGWLSWIAHDFFRQRHFHHHRVYNSKHFWTEVYQESCEIAFIPLSILYLAIVALLTISGKILWYNSLTLIAGSLIYTILVFGYLHSLYHVEESIIKNIWIFKYNWIWRLFSWLRRYHYVHHKIRGNYVIGNPFFDLIGGTYVSPDKLLDKQSERMFDGFNPRLISSCDGPIISRDNSN